MPDMVTTYKVEGEKEYKEALKSINSGLSVLRSESKKVAEQFADQTDSLDALNAENETLDKTVLSLSDKLALQKKRLEEVGKAYGEADSRTQRMKVAVNETEAALIKAERELKKNTSALDNYSKAEKDSEDNSKGLGQVIDDLAGKFGVKLPDGLKSSLDSMAKVDSASLGLIATMAAVAVAVVKVEEALIKLSVAQAAWAKETTNSAAQLNMSTKEYQQWDSVMKSVGYSMDQAKGDLSALAEKAQDAANGAGESAEMFELLGVSVANNDGSMKTQSQLFSEVCDALNEMEDKTQRNAIASKLLSTTGEEGVIPMLEKYGAALAGVRNSANFVDERQVQQLDELSNALAEFENNINIAKSGIAAEFAPSLERALQVVGELALQFSEFAQDTGLVDMFGMLLQVVAELVSALTPLLKILELLKPLIQAVTGFLAGFADIISLVVDSVRYLVTGIDALINGFDRMNLTKLNEIESSMSRILKGQGAWGTWAMSVGSNAEGTSNWRGGLTWVGEKGPELVNLPAGSQVFSNSDSMRMSGGDTFMISVDMSRISDVQSLVNMCNNYRRSVRMGYGG